MSRKALYISYNGALEQIVPSQVVPYLGELSKKGYEFSLLTFEKRDRIRQAGRQGMAGIRNRLKAKGIEWLWLPYHKRMPLAAALLDITIGAAYASYLVLFKKVKVVHARSIVPAVMCMIPKILGAKFIFDTRGLLAEEYVGGGHWKKGSLSYRLVKFFEAVALKMADSVVVLTNKHHQYLLDMRIFENRMAGSYIEVIPCCVDTDRFRPKGAKFIQHDSAGLRGDFIFTYLGKIGKHYMLDEMLDFLKIGFEVLPESKFMALTQDKPGQIISAAKRRMLDTGRIIVKKPSYEQIPELIRMSQAGIFFINP